MNQARLKIDISSQNLFDLNDLRCGVNNEEFVRHIQSKQYALLHVSDIYRLYEESLYLSKAFFSLSDNEKGTAILTDNEYQGYISGDFNGNVVNALVHEVAKRERGWVSKGNVNSRMPKEYFQYGHELKQDEICEGWIQNVWPQEGLIQGFKEVKLRLLSLYDNVHEVIFHCIENVLGIPEILMWPRNVMVRDTYYIPVNEDSVAVRNACHVDLGEITLIHVEPGLEILIDDEWSEFDSEKWCSDIILCITGLALEIKSGGVIKASPHRVVCHDRLSGSKVRYSCVSFGNGGVNDILKPQLKMNNSMKEYLPIKRNILPLVGNKKYTETIKEKRCL